MSKHLMTSRATAAANAWRGLCALRAHPWGRCTQS